MRDRTAHPVWKKLLLPLIDLILLYAENSIMKTNRLIVLIVNLLIVTSSFGQDNIIKKDGNEIEAKVIEITDEFIKYKAYDFQDGPLRNIAITDVFMIIYENGKRETFAAGVNAPEQVPEQAL